ncbi:MAG: hypothetical protein ACTSX9_06460 [Candidatus Njordarchaeales archaeon]
MKKLLDILGIIVWLVIIATSVHVILFSKPIGGLSTIIGVALTLITIYLLPIWKPEETPQTMTLRKELRELLGNLAMKIKRGYYKYFTGDYLKAYSLEYLTYRARLDYYRTKLALYLAPLLALSLISIPAALILFILPFLKIIQKEELGLIDRAFLTIAYASLIAYLAYIPFSPKAAPLFNSLVLNIPYLLGGTMGLILYLLVIM